MPSSMLEPFQKPKWFTAIIPIILTVNIERCLKTLYKYTEEDSFYVYIIDQSVHGLDATKLRNTYKNLMIIRTPKSNIHHTGNLGFAGATNLGISLVQTPYFIMLNDDVEMINSRWWQGVLDTFQQVEEATPSSPPVMVCPASIRLADWSVGRANGDDFDILPYKEEYTQEDYDFLLNQEHYVNEYLTIQPGSVFDGVTMYACVCDTRRFLEVGMLDEFWYPGSAEDYDYSCLARMKSYRSVATTKSWVWHHWSSTFRALNNEKEEARSLIQENLRQGNLNDKWGMMINSNGEEVSRFDLWGAKCSQCNNPLQIEKDNDKIAICKDHPNEKYKMPESTQMPL